MVAHRVLGASSELGATVVSLEDLWGPDAARIQEQLRAARSWSDRFAIAEAALSRRYDAGRAVDPEVGFAWSRLMAARGQVRVERLAAEVGWSRKRVWSRFRSQIGPILSPMRPFAACTAGSACISRPDSLKTQTTSSTWFPAEG